MVELTDICKFGSHLDFMMLIFFITSSHFDQTLMYSSTFQKPSILGLNSTSLNLLQRSKISLAHAYSSCSLDENFGIIVRLELYPRNIFFAKSCSTRNAKKRKCSFSINGSPQKTCTTSRSLTLLMSCKYSSVSSPN